MGFSRDLTIDGNGLARRGLLIRHLVMPGGGAGTREIMEFLATEISRDAYDVARQAGLHRLDQR